MAVYAIGDLQGCHDELQLLLEKLDFDTACDQAWFTGDLVNRGPKSLETLRTIRSMGDSAITVLGNHDLHLLAVAHGVSPPRRRDTFNDILEAPDRDELLDWLRHRPLLHHSQGFYLIHAGLPPQWSLEDARIHAKEVEDVLQGPEPVALFRQMYGNHPDQWSDSLTGWDRLRFTTNCLTRLRYCTPDGKLDFSEKGRPGTQRKGLIPWFDAASRQSMLDTVVFGHWSTLGFHAAGNVIGLDTGCLWGGELTAVRLDCQPLARTSVPSLHGGYQQP